MNNMRDLYDVVIIGGAVIGSSVAYYLSANTDFNGRVLVVEKDPSYRFASTTLSAASLRVQFSNEMNVRISQYGADVIRRFADQMAVETDGPDLHFHEGGYLFLANTREQAETLRANHDIQRACGADVVLWDAQALSAAFPHLRVDDIILASYGRSGEGWFDNSGLLTGFRNKALSQGAEYRADEVVAITPEAGRVTSVTLKSGETVRAGTVVNASGPRAALTARMAGLDLPVEPRKRTTFVFDCATSPEGSATINGGRLPLMVDPSGAYCRPDGRFFLGAAVPEMDAAADWDDFEPNAHEFEDRLWPALAARSEYFEALKVKAHWAGHYAVNVTDHNMVVGRHPALENFIFANGFSGHGLQQSPAVGRGVSELIVYGGFRSLDLSAAGVERILENRTFRETSVI